MKLAPTPNDDARAADPNADAGAGVARASAAKDAPAVRDRREGPNLLRGLGALGICWYHLLTTFWFQTPDGDFYAFLRTTVRYLWPSIPFFLVISGFAIPTALRRAGYKVSAYPTFMLKRLVRLEPPYLVAIALILVASYLYARHAGLPFLVEGEPVTWARVVLHLGYLNAFTEHRWLSLPFWMLAVEFQYYVVMGLAFPLFASADRRLRIAVVLCAGLLCLLLTGRPTPGKVVLSSFFTTYTFLFLLGVLTFQYSERLSGRLEYLALLAFALAGSWLTVGPAAAVSGALTVAVTLFYHRETRVMSFLGRISYPFYLLHWFVCPVVLSLASSKLAVTRHDVGKTLALLSSIAVCVAASYALHLAVERPAQRAASRLKYRKKKEDERETAARPVAVGATDGGVA